MKCEFEFVCNRKWEDLIETGNETMRFCSHCSQNVYLARDNFQLEQLASKKLCAYFAPIESPKTTTEPYLELTGLLGRVVSK
ncbi:hypothetical protein BCU68_11615 [Vibrio sp. 10N.286.49.B3]|nr:hypothetical protein BCU68_11615 [Vibrio sp. 10N.286.49.B3]